MPTDKKKKGTRQRTIAPELLKQWKKLVRKGDPDAIAKELNYSKPTVTNALTYGCAHDQALIDGINKFFADRLESERETAGKLEELSSKQ